jgi:WD40 repeat protein
MVKAMFLDKLRIAALFFLVLAGSCAGLALAMQGPPRSDGVVEQPARQEERKPGAGAGAGVAPDTRRPIRTLSGHKERVTAVAYSPDGRWIATAAWDGTVRLWDAQTGKEERRLEVPATRHFDPARFFGILFSPDNEFLVATLGDTPDEAVIVWNRRTGDKVRTLQGGSVAFSPDGRLLACGGRGVIRLHELATGKLVREMHGQQSVIRSLTFSPDGRTLVSRGPLPRPRQEGTLERLGRLPDVVRVWDVTTGKEQRSRLEGLIAEHFALSPDGRTLALAGSSFSLREIATGGERVKLIGHTHSICTVVFSPDGRTLASGSMDGTVRLWDLPTGQEVGRFGQEVPRFAGRGWVLAVAFSPDGRTLVSGGLDQTAHVWDVSRVTERRVALAERSPAELEADWRDLAGDAAAGGAALGRLVSSPGRAVAFLGKQLQSAEPVDARRIERLLADLDNGRFEVRAKASRELEVLAERAEPALRKALAGKPSLEVRRRLEALLDRLAGARPSAETVRLIRAVEALEFIGNPEARRLLDKLAAAPGETWLTRQAREAAGRLAKRASVAP